MPEEFWALRLGLQAGEFDDFETTAREFTPRIGLETAARTCRAGRAADHQGFRKL
jgi:hypothetical protein